MALITCKDCKKEFSTDAKRCIHCGARKPNEHRLLKGLLILGFLGVMLSLCTKQTPSPTLPAEYQTKIDQPAVSSTDPIANAEAILRSDTNTKTIVDAILDLSRLKKEEDPQKYARSLELTKQLNDKREAIYKQMGASNIVSNSHWRYDSEEDSMTSKKTYFASVESTSTLNFDFPYSGTQHATLTLRTHPRYGKNIILSIDKGQFLCNSYDGCSVLVRFDEGPAVRYHASEPSDHSSTTIFISNYSGFVAKLLKAKKLRISAEFYHSGSQVMEFDVSSFDQAQYTSKK